MGRNYSLHHITYNTLKHSTTKLTPHYLLFGVEPNQTIDPIFPRLSASISGTNKTIGEYIQGVRIKWKHALDCSNMLTASVHEKKGQIYDRNKVESMSKRNDLVQVRDYNRKIGSIEKLQNRYKGPYLITEIADNGLNYT